MWCSVLQCAVGCRCSALQGVVAVCCAVSLCNSYIYPVCKCVAVCCSALKCAVAVFSRVCCGVLQCAVAVFSRVSLSTSHITPVFKCAAVRCSAQLQCFARVSLSTWYIKPVSKFSTTADEPCVTEVAVCSLWQEKPTMCEGKTEVPRRACRN